VLIGSESNRLDRWIREAIHIRKEQDKSMNQEEASCQLPHICDLFTVCHSDTWWTVILKKAAAVAETSTIKE